MPDHRQEPCEKDAALFVTVKPAFSSLQFCLADEEITTPPSDHYAAEPKCYPITHRGAEPRAKSSRRDHSVDIHFSFRGQECRRRNDQFARYGKDRAFHR